MTSVMVPMRPDLNQALLEYGQKEEGRKGFFNQWVIDSLVEDDVVVVDLFDKVYEGTYVGGNLSTAIAARTKRGGAVIWGGIRDNRADCGNPQYSGVLPRRRPHCHRQRDPDGINVPHVRQGHRLPGDVVLGTISGVIFVPAHLAEKVVVHAEKSHIKDVFWFPASVREKIHYGADRFPLGPWRCLRISWSGFKTDPEAQEYAHLDWTEDREELMKWHEEHPEGKTEVTL